MFLKIFGKQARNTQHLFNGQYIDPRALFLYHFDTPPCISYLTDVAVNDAYPVLRQRLNNCTTEVLQHARFCRDRLCNAASHELIAAVLQGRLFFSVVRQRMR